MFNLNDKENRKRNLTLILFAVMILLAIYFKITEPETTDDSKPKENTLINKVSFVCNDQKSIQAKFFKQNVTLDLSDGRHKSLSQTVSASGARYADADGSFVFWNKGDTAFVDEKDERTFDSCIIKKTGMPEIPAGWNIYSDPARGFTIYYPKDYSFVANYKYELLGPGDEIRGVSFTIPESYTVGTNLSSDTRLSIETMPLLSACSASPFLSSPGHLEMISEDGVEYSYADSMGAAAGNLYEEKIYAVPGSSPCTALRYMIHSSNIHNYDPGSVEEFDKKKLLDEFDAIRKTLFIEHQNG